MFSLEMSKEQKMIKSEVAKLVKNLVSDDATEMDSNGMIPADAVQKAWELGAAVSMVAEEYGGFGLDDSPITTAIVLEELAAGDMAFAIQTLLPLLMIRPIIDMGTAQQQAKYLPALCNETYTPSTLAINEPHFAFDATQLETRAQKKNGAYVLNGRKCFVPLAKDASHIMVAAEMDGQNQLFIVDPGTTGMTIGDKEKNLGLYALETYELKLDNCEIPAENRLGGDAGCDYQKFLQKSRIGMSAIGVGVSRAAFEFAMEYAKQRVQFGEPIVHKQSIAFMIAEMAYEVDAIRLMTWQAASKLEAGKDAKREAYLAKLYAGEKTMMVTDCSVQILGGHGYTKEYPVERYYRNGRGVSIIEAMATV